MTVYFHIGLPKTATTFWQYSVFSKIPDLSFVHRSRNPETSRFINRMNRHVHRDQPGKVLDDPATLSQRLAQYQDGRDVFLSNENLSMTSSGFWNGRNATPEDVASFLGMLAEGLGQSDVKVIFGTRRPDTWLASRYAESSKVFAEFGQQDFERRMAELVDSDVIDGPVKWLDRSYVQRAIESVFGAGVFHVTRMEDLEETPRETILKMGAVLGGRDFSGIVADLERDGDLAKRRNSLSRRGGVWQMRSSNAKLSFPEPLRARILDRFAV